MKKKEYYKIEAIQVLLFPIMLAFVTWAMTAGGYIKSEYAPVIWNVVAVTVIASLLSIGVAYIFEK